MKPDLNKDAHVLITLIPCDCAMLQLLELAEEIGHTIVHCTYTSKKKYANGGWVNIWPSTYLVQKGKSNQLRLLYAINIPMAPGKHIFKQSGLVKNFTLIFSRVPKNWHFFTLREFAGSNPGFTVHNLQRNETGVYRIELK